MSQSFEPVGPAWLRYVWTFLFSAVVAAGFTIVGFLMFARGDSSWRTPADWGAQYLAYLVVSLAIGYSIHALFSLARRALGVARIRRFTKWQRTLFFSAIPLSGVFIGMWIGLTLLGNNVRAWATSGEPNSVVGSILFALLVWFLFSVYFSTRHQKLAAERRAAQAQLRLLQGQMEPHFLFNTLANIVSLMDADPPRAKLMLESFTDYLRASLGSLRDAEQTLGDELDLIAAYLRVVKVRMEERLEYHIEVPAALRTLRLPALSLQPLVENAVVHGLEPKIEGGHVWITARCGAGSLAISVTDDGLGLDAARNSVSRGTGTALNNIRERLRQTHGDAGRLQIEPSVPHGVRATLTLPLPS